MKLYASILLFVFGATSPFAQPQVEGWNRGAITNLATKIGFYDNLLIVSSENAISYGLGSSASIFNQISATTVGVYFDRLTDFEQDFNTQAIWASGFSSASSGYLFLLDKNLNGFSYQPRSLIQTVPIWALAKDKWNTIFLATRSGVQNYNPSSRQFTRVAQNFLPSVAAYTADVTHGGDVLVGMASGLFVQETSDATRWQSAGLNNQAVVYVYCDNVSEVWYAAVVLNSPNNGRFDSTTQLFRSSTKGVTWTATNLSGVAIRKIAKYTDTQTLLAATNLGIFVSEDNGRSWYKSKFNLDTYDLQLIEGAGFGVHAATPYGLYSSFEAVRILANEDETTTTHQLSFFPNPNPKYLLFEPSFSGMFEIYTLLGKRVWTAPFEAFQNRLSLPSLPSGTYIGQIIHGKDVWQKMFTIVQ